MLSICSEQTPSSATRRCSGPRFRSFAACVTFCFVVCARNRQLPDKAPSSDSTQLFERGPAPGLWLTDMAEKMPVGILTLPSYCSARHARSHNNEAVHVGS